MFHKTYLAILIALSLISDAKAMSPEEMRSIAAIDSVCKSVVLIAASGVRPDDNGVDIQQFQSTGSGFAVEPGFVVTNFHVVEYASQIEVILADYTGARASVVGTAPAYDLALLRVPFSSQELPPINSKAFAEPMVGQTAIAISNPLGLQHSVSRGIISGIQREFPTFEIGPRLIQFDTPINPGQSGGPLVDSDGNVIGMTTFKLLNAESIGFAVPFDLIMASVPDLKAMGHLFRPELGFRGASIDPDLALLFDLPTDWGVLIEDVEEGSVAEQIGLRSGERSVTILGRTYVLGGDVIVSMNGRPVRGTSDLVELFMGAHPGQSVTLRVVRGREFMTIQLTVPAMRH